MPYRILNLPDVFRPVLEIGLEVRHELASVGAINDAVIEAEREALDRTDGDGVVAVFVGDDFGFFVQTADAEDRALRLVDDGSAKLLAKDSGVGEGECASGDLVWSELLVPCAIRHIDDTAGDAEEVLLLGLLQDGNDEAPVECYGDANVDVLVVADGIAFDGSVDDGMLAQSYDGRAGDEGHVRELDAVTLLVLGLLLLAELDDARHIHLEDGVDVRAGALGLDHPLGDDGAHLGHGDEFAGLWLRGYGLRSRCRGGCRGSRWRCCDGLWTLLQMADDIGFGDAAGCSCPGDLGEIDVVVLGNLADERRRADAVACCG